MNITSIWHGAVYAEYQKRYQELARLGHTVTLIAPRRWSYGLAAPMGLEVLPDAAFEVRALPVLLDNHGATFLYRGLDAALAASRPDLIECIEEPWSAAAWQSLRWRDRRSPGTAFVISTCQNLHKRYPPPFGWIERRVIAEADAFTGLNQESLDIYRKKGYRGPTRVVPTGIDPEVFRPLPDRRRFMEDGSLVIGYAGRLVAEKGVDTLIRALAQISIPARLRLAGDGPDGERLRSLAVQHGVADRIEWLGPVAQADMPAFLNRVDVLVLPSLTRPNWKEQFGRVLVEAMACGTNVMGSDSGEIPRVIGEAGLVFREGQHEELAARLEELAGEPAKAESLREAGLARVREKYTWRVIAEGLAEFLEEL